MCGVMRLTNSLHPSVEQFKVFINQYPPLIKEIRREGRSWQEIYEKWALLGEEDAYWEKYKEQQTEKEGALLSQVTNFFSDLDVEKVQKYIVQLQQMLQLFQGVLIDQEQEQKQNPEVRQRQNTFPFYRD